MLTEMFCELSVVCLLAVSSSLMCVAWLARSAGRAAPAAAVVWLRSLSAATQLKSPADLKEQWSVLRNPDSRHSPVRARARGRNRREEEGAEGVQDLWTDASEHRCCNLLFDLSMRV